MNSRHLAVIVTAITLSAIFTEASWAWSNEDNQMTSFRRRRSDTLNQTVPAAAASLNETQGRHLYSDQEIFSIDTNNETTSIDDVVESILYSSREGRNLDGYDELYTDPSVQDALQNGDDTQARNLIKEKLCSLGLMQCDVEGKRFYRPPYHGHPNKFGPPPPPPGAFVNKGHFYGPPKPVPPPNYSKFGPPRKVGYDIRTPPNYNGPYLESPPSGSSVIISKPPPGSVIYGSKPPGPVFEGVDAPYEFENIGEKIHVENTKDSYFQSQQSLHGSASGKPTIVVNAQGGIVDNGYGTTGSGVSTLQQHVHHHFHHLDAAGNKIPSGSANTGDSEFSILASSSTAGFSPIIPNHDTKKDFTQTAAFTAGFNGASHQSGGFYSQNLFSGVTDEVKPIPGLYENGIKPVVESNNNYATSGLGNYGSGYTNNYAGYYNKNEGNSHVKPDYYKKELNLNGGGSQFNSLSNYNEQNKFGGNQYAQSFGQNNYNNNYQYNGISRQQYADCVCTPLYQCPASERIGRKDDLILPLDPRSLATDIAALDEDNTNTTAKISQNSNVNDTTQNVEGVSKKVKRDVAEKKQSEEGEEGSANIEPRLIFGNNNFPQSTSIGLNKRKILPTFGVSFGLPYPTGAYPLNQYGGVPLQNQHFGAISPNGLNLGPINVNPLVSLQVSKTEYGEKVVKPYVNLHVTPNANLIHHVGNLFHHKKQAILNKHEHFHHHSHYAPSAPYIPHNIHSSYPENIYPSYPENIHPTFHETSYPRPPVIFSPKPNPYETGAYGHLHSAPPPPPYNHFEPDYEYPIIPFGRSLNISRDIQFPGNGYAQNYRQYSDENSNNRHRQEYHSSSYKQNLHTQIPGNAEGSDKVSFPNSRKKRSSSYGSIHYQNETNNLGYVTLQKRQAFYNGIPQQCAANEVCCRRQYRPQPQQQFGKCGTRNAHGITGRIKNPVYIDGDSEFGEYPWQAAILKKDPKESVFVCGGTIIDQLHIATAAHCIKMYHGFDLRVRLGEWDVNHDVEFFPHIERDVVSVHVHPEYYAGTLENDIAIVKLDHPIDFAKYPHITPACLPDKFSDFTGVRCWTTGWGKDAFGDFGKYQNILKEVDVPVISQHQCQNQLRHTRLGYNYNLHPGFICAGGEEGKDACKGDGGGPMVCERNGVWQLVGIVSWGIGCGQVNVPGVYVRVSHYLDWIHQITRSY